MHACERSKCGEESRSAVGSQRRSASAAAAELACTSRLRHVFVRIDHSDIYARSLKGRYQTIPQSNSHATRAKSACWGLSAHHVSRQSLPRLLTSSKCLSSPVRPDLNPSIEIASLNLPPTPKTRLPFIGLTRRSITTTDARTGTAHRTSSRRKHSTASRGRSHTGEPCLEAIMARSEVLGWRASVAKNGYAE